jgi:cytochrome c peroxidase
VRALLLGVALITACTGRPAPVTRAAGDWDAPELARLASLRLDATPRPDPSNRWADHDGAAELGQTLFFDHGMSPSGTISCATCHDPGRGFTDGLRVSQGVGHTTRNAPAVIGSQYSPWLFWDGRADSLWAQAAGPVESAVEMGSDRMYVARYVTTKHAEAWRATFGDVPDFSDSDRFPEHARPDEARSPEAQAWLGMAEADRHLVTQTFTRAMKAIAAYERRLVPTESDFDRYVDAVAGGDPTGGGHLSEPAVRGLGTFLRDGRCTDCHHGPLLTDRAFHNLGLPFAGSYDAGRSIGASEVLEHELGCRSEWSDTQACPELDYLDPSFPDFQQAFKTPTLRNVALTGPYMHHGELPDLHAVVTFYSDLPGDAASNHRELTLRPLALDEARKLELIAFLTALTGDPLPASLTTDPAHP